MPRKRRIPKRRHGDEVHPVLQKALQDQPVKREERAALFFLTLEQAEARWQEYGSRIVTEWIKEHPGTRPSRWWLHSAPRATEQDLVTMNFVGEYRVRADAICRPRLRIDGIGTPMHEAFGFTPVLAYGLPTAWCITLDGNLQRDCWYDWREQHIRYGGSALAGYLKPNTAACGIDALSPPRFESEAAYLQRHDLLTATEKRHLSEHPELFTPETIAINCLFVRNNLFVGKEAIQ
jgi:hypothetical protein